MARERSQEKGRGYQRAVGDWLHGRKLLGYKKAALMANAYDASHLACRLGDEHFDFTMALGVPKNAHSILYAECKFRSKPGGLNSEFDSFVARAYRALASVAVAEREEAQFLFVASMPPSESWLEFLKQGSTYVENVVQEEGAEIDPVIADKVADSMHILVLSSAMLGHG